MDHDYINQFNLIDQYLLGKLAGDEVDEFEEHFVDCSECVERLSVARSFIQDLKRLTVQQTLLSGNSPAPLARRRTFGQLTTLRLLAAIASCCIVVVAVFTLLAVRRLNRLEGELRQTKEAAFALSQQYRQASAAAADSENQHQKTRQELAQRIGELEEKLKTQGAAGKGDQFADRGSEASEVNFPIYALVSVARGQAPSPVDISPPVSSRSFAISIPVEDNRNFSVYRVIIVDHQGVTVWKQGGFRPDSYHTLSLSLRSSFLSRGTYELRVEGLTPPSQWSTIGSYPFRVTR